MAKAYSLVEHTCNFAGIEISEAVGKITTKAKGEIYTEKSGTDGTTTISENLGNANRTAEIEIEYGSSVHALLSAFFNIVLAAGGGMAGLAPFVIKDRQGTTLEITDEAYIKGWPDLERAAESGTITWMIGLIRPKMFIGGLAG